jgi:hypothetical protein
MEKVPARGSAVAPTVIIVAAVMKNRTAILDFRADSGMVRMRDPPGAGSELQAYSKFNAN